MKMMKWINTIAFGAMVIVNALANLIPIGGNTTAEVSAAYPTLFTPAPLTFAIWGLIYLMMLFFVIYQWRGEGENGSVVQELGPWFAVSCIMNIAWIFSWHLGAIELSVIYIVGLLISLAAVERSLGFVSEDGFLRRAAVDAGFDLYFGWIIAATIANVAAALVKIGWNGFGRSDEFWTVVMLLVGAIIACLVVITEGRWISALAVIWAYAGILLRHFSAGGFAGRYPIVIAAAFISIAAMTLCVVIELVSHTKHSYEPLAGRG